MCRALLPPSPGTYVVILRSDIEQRLRIGRAGPMDTLAGYYLYVGSARGPGGLRARAGRHLSGHGKPRWHIDYLRAQTTAIDVWFDTDSDTTEHDWAGVLATLSDTSQPLQGFGASDCNCSSHLYFMPEQPRIENFRKALQRNGMATTLRSVR